MLFYARTKQKVTLESKPPQFKHIGQTTSIGGEGVFAIFLQPYCNWDKFSSTIRIPRGTVTRQTSIILPTAM